MPGQAGLRGPYSISWSRVLAGRCEVQSELYMVKPPQMADAWVGEEGAFQRILGGQVLRYPKLEEQDLYKLIYQAAMGCEHALQDPAAARSWLERECRGLAGAPEEPVVDPISPDGRVARVNLRPYVAEGGDLSVLVDAFLRTAREFHGSQERLRRYWSYLERMALQGRLPFAPSALEGLFARMEARQFPPAHHSAIYVAEYHPAYRVIQRELLAWPP